MMRSASERNPIIESYSPPPPPLETTPETNPTSSSPSQTHTSSNLSVPDSASSPQFESSENHPVNEGISFPPGASGSQSFEGQEWLSIVNDAIQALQSLNPPEQSGLSRLVNSFEQMFITLRSTISENPVSSPTEANEQNEVPTETTETDETSPSENPTPNIELALLNLDEELEGNQLAQEIESILQDYLNLEDAKFDKQISGFLDEQLQHIRETHDRQQAVNRIIDALRNMVRVNIEDSIHY